jgi:drug/metabolite transporter (DMT)-like permease
VRSRHVAALCLLALIWGASYLLINLALRDLSPPMVVFGRTALASLCLSGLLVAREKGAMTRLLRDVRRRPGWTVLVGSLAVALPFLLITLGELSVPTGLAAVLVATAPIFIAILAPLFDPSEQANPRQWAGLLVGLAGVGLLVGFESVGSFAAILGALAILVSSLSYAVSGFAIKAVYPGFSAVSVSLVTTAVSALLTLPAAAATFPDRRPGGLAVLSVVLLGVVGTAFAFALYYRLMDEVGVGQSALVAYLIPPVSLAYGAIILDEQVTPAVIGGMVLILLGTALAARRRPVRGGPSAARG